MKQIDLLTVPAPKAPANIDLRLASVETVIAELAQAERKPSLIIADPPWSYTNSKSEFLEGSPENHYNLITDDQIAEGLASAYDAADPNSRLAVWCTWPKLGEWFEAVDRCDSWRWQYKTGGSWHKKGGIGVGFHWLGQSELVLIYTKGAPTTDRTIAVPNAHESKRRNHSEKPDDWIAQWFDRWTEPDDLILDLFAGLAPVARACARKNRDYIGAEIDPQRHREALDLLALDKRNR